MLNPHRRQVALAIAAILVTVVALGLPLFLNGFPLRTHDGRIHSMWSSQLTKQFWAGELYPRWLSDVNGGLGSPAFFYYPPFAHLATAALDLINPGAEPLFAMGLSAAASLAVSGLASLLWLRRVVPLWPAVAGALCYVVGPYHLALGLYTRGALGELWGMAWLPLVLWATHRVLAGQRDAVPVLACSYALLITSHLPTTLEPIS